MNTKNVSRLWLVLAFIAIYFIWGTTYLANLFALKGIPPFIISALRYLVAGLVLAAIAYSKKKTFPDRKEVRDLSVSGVLMLVGGSGLVVVAEKYITSGAAAVIIATEPFWFVLLDAPRWRLYFSEKKVILGLLLGFMGILLFTRFTPAADPHPAQSDNVLLGTGLVLAGAVLWVIGTLYASRRIKAGRYTLWHPTIQLLSASIFAGVIALIKGEWYTFTLSAVSLSAWGGLGFLIFFGSLIAYLAFAWLVTVRPPALVSTHTYVNPPVAVLAGWLAVGEPIVGGQLVALAVVLTGVVLTQMSKSAIEA